MDFSGVTSLYPSVVESASPTTEWPVKDPPQGSVAAARADVGAEREVLLWQRWARYAAAGLVGLGAGVVRGVGTATHLWLPLAMIGVAYALFTAGVAWHLRRTAPRTVPSGLGALVLSTDLLAAAGVVYCMAPARNYDCLLILGLAAVQVAVVYYGLSIALWGLVATLVAFVGGSLLVTPAVAGPPVDPRSVALTALAFLFAGCALIYAFGSFRSRMNALRRFCRDVEVGELGGSLDARTEGRPDDLTLLARSVDEMRHRLIELIGTDPLTGCLNRRALETRLARGCRQARRRGTPLALLAVDVDHFKSINDTYGHPFGDYVLQAVADILRDTARDTDAVARLGGDEFVLVLADTGWPGAHAFAERLRCNVDGHAFVEGTTSVAATISVGVAVASVIGDETPAALLADADRSLYRAKSAGRNRISA
jgi:diguanylate cyclase (GGDEF)-like protein